MPDLSEFSLTGNVNSDFYIIALSLAFIMCFLIKNKQLMHDFVQAVFETKIYSANFNSFSFRGVFYYTESNFCHFSNSKF